MAFLALCVRAEEDRCSKDPLERCHKTSILCPALLHAESVQHRGSAAELNTRLC